VLCKHGLGKEDPPPLGSRGIESLTTFSTVISAFAILILSVLGLLFRNNHPELVGGDEDPSNGPEVAATIFIAVFIYAVSRPGYKEFGHMGSMLIMLLPIRVSLSSADYKACYMYERIEEALLRYKLHMRIGR
jgi:hypothetical protein